MHKFNEKIADYLQSEEAEHHDERMLLTRLKSGEKLAFEILYDRYRSQITRNLLRLVKCEELAEDILQNLFIKVWDIRASLDEQKSFRSYLFRISENMVMDYYRRSSIDKKIRERLVQSGTDIYSHIEESIFTKEDQEILYAAIEMLPPKRKEVFLLCKLDGKSYKEVSKLLGISHSTINDHLYKAHLFLKKHFKPESDNMSLLIVAAILIGIR